MSYKNRLVNYYTSMSYLGIVLAVVFFSVSLSPSLLPRPLLLQGVLSGLLLALGYSLGAAVKWLWNYLHLPLLSNKVQTPLKLLVTLLSAVLFVYSIYYSTQWHNDLRQLMALPATGYMPHLYMTLLSLSLALLLLLLAKAIIGLFIRVKSKLKTAIPQRVANVLSFALVALIVFLFTNKVIVSKVVSVIDDTYALLDENIGSDLLAPMRSSATGSENSLISWSTLGKAGQEFINFAPTKQAIEKFHQAQSKQPLRVYVGLRAKDTVEQRAELALQELIRVNAFKRSKLVIATPTGTGWLDPFAMDTLEYIHQGDTAIVAMQYSYLPSWLTLLVDPSSARQSAAALYNKVHGYWAKLDKDKRPDLYLFGLSLGAYGAETSINLTTVINNPIQGGLFVGAPFTSMFLPLLTKNRNPNSPPWLPQVQDGSMVRFTAQENALNNRDWQWGPMRFVYVQYASDPIVFFSTDMYRKEPDWMKQPRGHDVSPAFQWLPLISFFQVLFDLPMADKVPRGNGHHYSASSYIDGWLAVTAPKSWRNEQNKQLSSHMINQ
ncbi:alpha/beta hydrolase [Litorilituus sediminis]|uniref:Alpha/beta-hydrolase catalytic domain-containing protein n=1 Tax=Litorilituus sediminis TaxID=718192 RepID=A0A4V0ZG68_9GAMM|nr:alpha/beta-hydrolase family protein [Litorilituus sediminis]QBG36250.1 hypothetical protein EMK97_11255 [Litorilituus sediminis]